MKMLLEQSDKPAWLEAPYNMRTPSKHYTSRIVAYIFPTFCYSTSFTTFDVNSICLYKHFFFSVPLELCVCTCLFFHSPILHSACTIYYRDSRMKFSPAVSHIQLLFCLNVVRLMQIFLWATFNYSHSMNCEKSVWNWIRYFLTFPPKKIQRI